MGLTLKLPTVTNTDPAAVTVRTTTAADSVAVLPTGYDGDINPANIAPSITSGTAIVNGTHTIPDAVATGGDFGMTTWDNGGAHRLLTDGLGTAIELGNSGNVGYGRSNTVDAAFQDRTVIGVVALRTGSGLSTTLISLFGMNGVIAGVISGKFGLLTRDPSTGVNTGIGALTGTSPTPAVTAKAVVALTMTATGKVTLRAVDAVTESDATVYQLGTIPAANTAIIGGSANSAVRIFRVLAWPRVLKPSELGDAIAKLRNLYSI